MIHREGRKVQKLGTFVRLRKSEGEDDDDDDKFHVPVDEFIGFPNFETFHVEWLTAFRDLQFCSILEVT